MPEGWPRRAADQRNQFGFGVDAASNPSGTGQPERCPKPQINTATGHKCTTHSEGSMAAAPPPAEPQNSLSACGVPHAVAVTRICARKDGGVYSTASDGRVCSTNDAGRPVSNSAARVDRVDGWQHDLELVEDQLLLAAGVARQGLGRKRAPRSRRYGATRGATRCVSGFAVNRVATGGDDGFCRVSDIARRRPASRN